MIIGEVGNFISYAFAPASIVAPLGTVCAFQELHCIHLHPLTQIQFALVANCFFAPMMLKEQFRKVCLTTIFGVFGLYRRSRVTLLALAWQFLEQ